MHVFVLFSLELIHIITYIHMHKCMYVLRSFITAREPLNVYVCVCVGGWVDVGGCRC
jgi:hypothetical protein